ncbi:hypothetical protein POB01_002759 [Enterococcus faecalis]|uniref:hypothetical protein n=1 Tax=Enterococcus faecalis TaxID=1351 RepID=UPI000CF050E5|nr:hypothetical protein [Enterococcus faecalis]EGO9358870.1 hypothetical protein [Enterococcus faecalis]EKK5902342.1 hypothetical protein [Enterococcus faecalis]PQB75263.1 hypothetical protein CUN23_03700 [Enterococcus faecalis]PQG21776.1 hypothetical protein CUS25_05355 [Enterococcus faecalis]PQG60860.1 hypothetical protein CUS54_07260 [Enterococcus faecalis]
MAKKDEVKELEAKNNIQEAEKKPFNKFGKQEKHTVEGVEYTFQFPGTRAAQAILDNSKGPSNTFSDVAYHSQLMDSVIVVPKLDWDYWDEHEGYREVMALADNFLGRMLN